MSDVDNQILSHAATMLAFEWKVPPYATVMLPAQVITENKQLLRRDHQLTYDPDWVPCGESNKQTDKRLFFTKARYNGFIIKSEQFLLMKGMIHCTSTNLVNFMPTR